MKNKLKHLVPVLLALATITGSLSACELKPKAQQKVSKQGFYFDTIIQITLYGTTDEKYIDDCFDMAKKYEDMLSNTVSYSEVSKINDAAGKEYVTVSDDTLELIKNGIEYGDTSDGRFDITIGKLSDLWNFSEIAENTDSKDNEVDASVVPSDAQIQSELSHVNYRNIQINGNDVMLTDSKAKLDLGGIAKGFIADKMKAYLQSKKITSGIINLGGNGDPYKEELERSLSVKNPTEVIIQSAYKSPSTRAVSQYVPSKSRTNPSSPQASTSGTTE